MLNVLLGITILYAAIQVAMAVGMQRVLRKRTQPSATLPRVTVIVPARDEAAVIARCLDRIFANDYPADRLEVIVVDDLSEDETPEIVRRYAAQLRPALVGAGGEEVATTPEASALHLLQIPENLERTRAHKKRAIEKAIAHATGEVILTTDADCEVPPQWVRRMVAPINDEVVFVSGPVLLHPGNTTLLRMQALEFLGLVAFGAGGIGIGLPNMANGANVAYRKDVFDALGGFSGIDHVTSGDDELLMQKIAYETKWRVTFCADPAAAVVTDPVMTIRGFFEQRRRWGSKGAHYPNPVLKGIALAVYLFHVVLLASLFVALFVPSLWGAVGVALVLKILSEISLMAPFARRFGRAWLLPYFLPAQFLQLPYIVIVGAAAAMGGYTWKGRKVAR